MGSCRMSKMFRPGSRYVSAFEWEFAEKEHWWERRKVVLTADLEFQWGDELIVVEKGYRSDGFSIPWIFTVFTLRYLRALMPGMAAAIPHDLVCEQGLLSRRERRELFHDCLLVVEMDQRRKRLLWEGVRVGSRYLGYC